MEKLTIDIKYEDVTSAYTLDFNFCEGKKFIEEHGFRIISAEENARLRIREGKHAYISQWGRNWIREGFIYIPQKGAFLTKKSPIMDNPEDATKANSKEMHYFITPEQMEWALSDSIKIKDIDFKVPVNHFGDDEITSYVFGDVAQSYGEFLADAGIDAMPVIVQRNIGDKPFCCQGSINFLHFKSALSGISRGLNCIYYVRGVK